MDASGHLGFPVDVGDVTTAQGGSSGDPHRASEDMIA